MAPDSGPVHRTASRPFPAPHSRILPGASLSSDSVGSFSLCRLRAHPPCSESFAAISCSRAASRQPRFRPYWPPGSIFVPLRPPTRSLSRVPGTLACLSFPFTANGPTDFLAPLTTNPSTPTTPAQPATSLSSRAPGLFPAFRRPPPRRHATDSHCPSTLAQPRVPRRFTSARSRGETVSGMRSANSEPRRPITSAAA